jgi:hypothetical protein
MEEIRMKAHVVPLEGSRYRKKCAQNKGTKCAQVLVETQVTSPSPTEMVILEVK